MACNRSRPFPTTFPNYRIDYSVNMKKYYYLSAIALCTILSTIIIIKCNRNKNTTLDLVVEALTQSETTEGSRCFDSYSREKDVDIRICSTYCILKNFSPTNFDYFKNCYSACPYE